VSVDAQKFGSSIHGVLKCGDCHADIKDYPHPDHIAQVECKTCHAEPSSQLAGSVHSSSKDHPCTSCHGDAHSIFPKTDAPPAMAPRGWQRSTAFPASIRYTWTPFMVLR
jgi:hypothetical protein